MSKLPGEAKLTLIELEGKAMESNIPHSRGWRGLSWLWKKRGEVHIYYVDLRGECRDVELYEV